MRYTFSINTMGGSNSGPRPIDVMAVLRNRFRVSPLPEMVRKEAEMAAVEPIDEDEDYPPNLVLPIIIHGAVSGQVHYDRAANDFLSPGVIQMGRYPAYGFISHIVLYFDKWSALMEFLMELNTFIGRDMDYKLGHYLDL